MNGEDEPCEDSHRDRRVSSADVQRADRGLGRGVGSIEYRPDEDVHRVVYDVWTASPSTVVVVVVSAVENADPLALDPIYSAIDLDALDLLLAPHAQSDDAILVTFSVRGHEVTVSSRGSVCVG